MAGINHAAIGSVGGFSRVHTRQLDPLGEGLLGSGLNLNEARVLYELAQRSRATISELAAQLQLALGYFSRLLRGLERRGLVERRPDSDDARWCWLTLSKRRRTRVGRLDQARTGGSPFRCSR